MALPLGLSLSYNFPSMSTVILSLPVYYFCFCLRILLMLSSRWVLPHHFHSRVRFIGASFFMDFGANLHVISVISMLHYCVAIPLHGSLYLQSWIYIVDLLILYFSYLMLFAPSIIIPWLFIISLRCHLVSTGIILASNLMPPVSKYRQFLLMMTLFLGSTVAINYIFSLIWRCYGPKQYILDYRVTIIYCLLFYCIVLKDKGL